MKKTLLCLQNDASAGPGYLESWAALNDHALQITRWHEGETPPELSAIDSLVVLGGTMGAYEEGRHPWLVSEKRYLAEALKAEKPLVGICLGAQLLANVLGARVYKGKFQEIGWFPVELTDTAIKDPLFEGFPPRFSGFHYHGDTFDLPTGSRLLASSQVYENQIFQWGRNVLGIQFHPEVDESILLGWVQDGLQGVPRYPEEPFVQGPHEILSQHERIEKQHQLFASLLDRFLPRT